jgi:hypothetical protein
MPHYKSPAWTRKEGQDPSGGLNAKRRISFCKRSAGQARMHGISCSKDPKKRICLARKKWNC